MKFSIEKSLEILERTPVVIKKMLDGLNDEWIYANEGDNTWSAFDVMGHLIEGEKSDWIPRMQIILSDSPEKKFEPFDRFKQFEESKGKNISQLIAEFKRLRQKNIKILKDAKIDKAALARKGIHPGLGEVTLQQLLATWVTHDLAHLLQISRVMVKQYREEIGPWEAYFSVFGGK